MKLIHEAWRKVESPGPTHKGNGSDSDATPLMTDRDPIMLAIDADATPARSDVGFETRLERCRLVDWNPDPKKMLFFGSEESAPGRENFRTLRSRLYQMRERAPLKTIVIVSSVPKEGRSFVAANLAQAMARQKGCRVLLIDGDLRSPSLHSALGTCQSPGLAEYLVGETEEMSIVQRGQMENLFFIAAGRTLSGQSEIVSNGRLKALLNQLATLFEWIIVDSPAALPVSDAELIAGSCDGALMVVRSNSTPFDLIRKARLRFREECILGVILNGIPAEAHVGNHYYSNQTKSNGKSR
jgi:protein-tyrosine kinase